MSCPTEAELMEMLAGETTSREQARLEEHLSRCPSCRSLFADLHLEARESEWRARPSRAPRWLKRQVEALPRNGAPAALRPPSRRWLAAAAALFIVTALGGIWLISRERARLPAPPSLLREESLAQAGPLLLEPAPEASRVEARISFRWSEIAGTHRYVLTILDAEGDIAYEADTPEPSLTVSLEEIALQGSAVEDGGRTYFWYVTSRLLDGTELESEIRRLMTR